MGDRFGYQVKWNKDEKSQKKKTWKESISIKENKAKGD